MMWAAIVDDDVITIVYSTDTLERYDYVGPSPNREAVDGICKRNMARINARLKDELAAIDAKYDAIKTANDQQYDGELRSFLIWWTFAFIGIGVAAHVLPWVLAALMTP